jgi:hypothetical protein
MSRPRFPSIRTVASALRAVNRDAEDECDVRLQVYPDGDWAVRFGPSDYDQDHRGYWGASSVPGHGRRFGAESVARDLIDQARDMAADNPDCD